MLAALPGWLMTVRVQLISCQDYNPHFIYLDDERDPVAILKIILRGSAGD